MFPTRAFPDRYFAPRYWPKTGAAPPAVTAIIISITAEAGRFSGPVLERARYPTVKDELGYIVPVVREDSRRSG